MSGPRSQLSDEFPPGEAPAAEAREEAALARELAPDAAPLDIALDEPPAEPARVARGAEAIRAFWRHAPMGPGVYRMIGAEGEVLYVGKARSIKKRITAYMAPERQPNRIARMVAQTHSMVFVTTESDAEALLLEANLIKQLKPRYNATTRASHISSSAPDIRRRGWSSTAARALSPATISARSPAPARCFAR
jgi:excinuclease ABC subunit C